MPVVTVVVNTPWPSCESFRRSPSCRCPSHPLSQYNPSTIDINSDPAEMAYWIGILQASLPCQQNGWQPATSALRLALSRPEFHVCRVCLRAAASAAPH